MKSLLIVASTLFSCNQSSDKHKLFFPESFEGWAVIVNGCKGKYLQPSDSLFFPKDGVILLNDPNFNFRRGGSTYLYDTAYRVKLFNPDNENNREIKICYYNAALNVGFNPNYYCEANDSLNLSSEKQEFRNFDLYFFKITVNCDTSYGDRFENIYKYLCDNKIESAK